MRLITFGRPHVARSSGDEVDLQPLTVVVLAYLAMEGPCDRDHLVDLFWHDTKNGPNSLSTALNRIRAQVPDGVWVDANNLMGTDLAFDVGELREAIERSDFESITQLYRGPFLGEMGLRRKNAKFEEWVLEERSTLASMVELAMLQRGRDLYAEDDLSAAANAVEMAWEIAMRDGFPSPDYFDAYHRILASAARPTARAVRSVAEEFGMALEPIQPIAFASSTQPAKSRSPLPTPSAANNAVPISATKQLFGAQKELAAIAASATSSQLTTIVGFGGSGKTRLAAEFFNSVEAEEGFHDRYWVNLRDVADAALVGPTIAASLGQKFEGVPSLAAALPDDQPVLVVLDSFEHLLEAAEIVEALLEGNGAIRILVTSRVPLEVAAESLVRLSGLRISDEESDSPAEQLLVSSARRAGVGDDRLTESGRTTIRDVCRSLGGNPLALEIAGGWMQVLSPQEILDTVSVSNDLLGSPVVGDLRSMKTVLNQSWATLAEAEQHTLMLLATFPAGCPTREALKLREVSIRSIGRLVQHSLVRLHIEGRITLHPLIATYALSELEKRPDLHREFHQVLSNWCVSFTASLQAIPSNPSHMQSRSLAAEVANFMSAWSWDAEHQLWELHRSTLGTLREFFTDSGRVSEGRTLFAMLADALRSDPNHPQDLLVASLEALGWFHMLSAELRQARTQLEQALALSPDADPHERAQLLRTLGAIQLTAGDIDEATASFDAGLALITDEPNALTASFHYYRAQAYSYRGDREQARTAARSALLAGRAVGDSAVMGRAYLLLGDIQVESNPQNAIALLNEGLAIVEEASLDRLAIYYPHIMGLAHLNLGKADLAEKHFADGMKAAKEVGALSTLGANHVGRAEARLLSGETAGAIEDLTMGIRLSLKTGSGRYLLWAAVATCRAAVHDHDASVGAKELLSLALNHPAADQDARDKAAKTWRDLFDDAVPQPKVNEDAKGLDAVAERSLGLLSMLSG